MEVSPTISGSMLTPFSTLVAFVGIPVGFLLAKTKKYRWMYNFSYAVVTLALLAMWRFTSSTPIWMYMLVTGILMQNSEVLILFQPQFFCTIFYYFLYPCFVQFFSLG